MIHYIWDLETFPNCFLFSGKFEDAPEVQTFEMSFRMNQRSEILSWVSYVQNTGAYMTGFNNIGFDYEILHDLLTQPYTFTELHAYNKAQQIITTNARGFGGVRPNDRIIPQVDLYKINHFDNPAKATGLKALEFAMRMDSVEDMPVEPGTYLTSEQIDQLRHYNVHDLVATELFLKKNKGFIAIRKELLDNGIITGDVLNYSDVKIGTEYLIKKIGRAKCFVSGSKPKQTLRDRVEFKSIILPKVSFRTPHFQAVCDWFREQTVWIGGENKIALETQLAGLPFHFGLGGVHASVKSKAYATSETHAILDVDVAGMYPAVADVNGFCPEHLGDDFVKAYRQLRLDRNQYAKGTSMNLVLKLAGNGASGNFENMYSPLYDPKCAYSVRINGQLLLIMLAELLSLVPGVEMIQANTDGITAYVPKNLIDFWNLWCNEWEAITGLKLEHNEYDRMFIRDVNNYIAIDTKGKIKRKGAYWYPITEDDYQGSSGSNWNKNFSNIASQKAAEYVMVDGMDIEAATRCLSNPFDFMLRYKTTGGAKLYIGDTPQLKTVRYYVSKSGGAMKKVSTPKGEIGAWKRRNGLKDSEFEKILATIPAGAWDERIHTKNKSRYEMVSTSVESGWKVKQCNHIRDFDWNDVDYDYYVEEAKKLVIDETR